jgi:1-acyl-sn-glycerol-3-phosphate acyltransferase
VVSVLCLGLSPVLLALAAVASAVIRRPQPLLLTRLLIRYFALELGVLTGCAFLWLLSGFGAAMRTSRIRDLHYRLLRFFVHGLAEHVLTLLDIDVAPSPSPDAERALERDRPLLFFSRHAGPADTVLLIDLLLTRYHREPSVVFKQALMFDPSIDLIGHRLPHAVLDVSDPEGCEAQIENVTEALGPRGVLVLFPEGGNFTPERRRQSLRKLRRKGRRREAAAGEAMSHVLPPHPTGALAALRANPDADVIFGAHTGLGTAAFPRELWRDTPIGATLKARMWLAPAVDRPTDPDEQVEWLYAWWKRLDTWLDGEGETSSP